jgi:hypothetical protein
MLDHIRQELKVIHIAHEVEGVIHSAETHENVLFEHRKELGERLEAP